MNSLHNQNENDEINQNSLKIDVFPLTEHPLYGTVDNFEDCTWLDPVDLANYTQDTEFEDDVTNLEICPTCFFQTTGTTSRSKRIPYSDNDLDRQKVHEAISFKKLGMQASDGVYSLGSPLPSISGWAIVNGSETLGASMLNTSQIDFETVFLRKQESKATVLFGTPIVVREIGLAIKEEHGELKDVFPNLRTAIIFGDVLPESFREEIKALWGFENVYSLYGTVEADVVGTQCLKENGQVHLMTERLLFEIIPETELQKERDMDNYTPKMYDISDVDDNTIGEIIISDLSREILPLIRYRIGDIIQVSQQTCKCEIHKPTISVLGRSKNTVVINNTPIYEMQINSALENTLGEDLSDWRLVQSEDKKHTYTLYLQTKSNRSYTSDEILEILTAISSYRVEHNIDDFVDNIEIKVLSTIKQALIKGDAKARRIVLAA